MKKLKTISLKGRQYVQVDTRVEYFNETYPNGKIETKPTFQDEKTVYFVATITPDIEKPERFFNGHSFGILGQEKALEKLETVAVGRALAFMGIGIVEGIASADEMARFTDNQGVEVKLGVCSKCGAQAVMSKSGNAYCPHYQLHKQEGETWHILAPVKEVHPKQQEMINKFNLK